ATLYRPDSDHPATNPHHLHAATTSTSATFTPVVPPSSRHRHRHPHLATATAVLVSPSATPPQPRCHSRELLVLLAPSGCVSFVKNTHRVRWIYISTNDGAFGFVNTRLCAFGL
nr:hypothetical protein [Tanacetum cinerariifolium]